MHAFYDFGLFGGGWHMIVLWILLLAVSIWLVFSLKNSNQNQPESALEIAKKRYAKGEISKTELDEITRSL
ncbi:MAG TPA: hypothetical protein VIS54_03160 [Psychromonas sp.]